MSYVQARIVLCACHGLALHDIWTNRNDVNRSALMQSLVKGWGLLGSLHPSSAAGDPRLSASRLANVEKLFQFFRYLALFVFIVLSCFYESRVYVGEISLDTQITLFGMGLWATLLRFLLAYPLTENRLDFIYFSASLTTTLYLFAVSWRHFIVTAAVGKMIRALLSVVYMKASYSSVANFFQMLVVMWRYRSELQSGLADEQHRFVGAGFCMCELFFWILVTSLCVLTQLWFSEFLRNETSLNSASQASERLLSGLCDSVVRLDQDLHITEATPHLGHLMCPTTPIDPRELEGSPFSQYLASESDRESFASFVSGVPVCDEEQSRDNSAATALRTHLHHAHGHEISVDLFHVHSIGADQRIKHLVGIREVRNDGASPDESLFQGHKTTFQHFAECSNDVMDDNNNSIKKWCRVPYERSESSRISRNNLRHLCAKSSSSSASSVRGPKRPLPGLRKVEFSVDFLNEGLVIQDYTLAFGRLEGIPTGAPEIASCIMLESMTCFNKWLQDGINKLLNQDAQQVVYSGEVAFRPPTAACASSKVNLSAESARLRWSSHKVDFPDGRKQRLLQLQLYDVAQVSERFKSIGRDDHHELPSLSEGKAEP